jgi:DNA-binding MarR family transcriptional regulator
MSDPDEIGLTSYLQRKGAIGILVQIDPQEGTLFGELADQVDVSQTTLSGLLDDGIGDNGELPVALFEEIRKLSDHGNANRYTLTPRGKKLREKLIELNMDEHYEAFLNAKRDLEQGQDEIIEQVRDTVIVDPSWPDHPKYQQQEDPQIDERF